MANEKVTNQKLIKRRRDTALLELALAASYPQTHTKNMLHRKHTNDAVPMTIEVGWLNFAVSPEDVLTHKVANEHLADRLHAAAGPLTTTATVRDPRPKQEKVCDDSEVIVSVAKPWKKPWDK
jgi:hypothetical protein